MNGRILKEQEAVHARFTKDQVARKQRGGGKQGSQGLEWRQWVLESQILERTISRVTKNNGDRRQTRQKNNYGYDTMLTLEIEAHRGRENNICIEYSK